MPKIQIAHKCTEASDTVFTKIKTFFEQDEDIKKIDSKISWNFDTSAKTGKAKGSQFTADIAVKSSGPGSEVAIAIDIPFLLSPFKGKIQETVERKLKKVLG